MTRFALFFGTIALFAILGPSIAQPPATPKTNDTPAFIPFDRKKYNIQPGDSELTKLLKQRVQAAVSEGELHFAEYISRGHSDADIQSARRILDARLALAENREKELAVRRDYLSMVRDSEKLNQARFDAGAIEQQDLEKAKFHWLDAEIRVLRLEEPNLTPPFDLVGGALPVPQQPRNNDDPKTQTVLPGFVRVQPFSIKDNEPKLHQLYKERANCAIQETRLLAIKRWIGRGRPFDLDVAAVRARDCRLEMADSPQRRLEVLSEYRDFVRDLADLDKYACLTPLGYLRPRLAYLGAELDVALFMAESSKPQPGAAAVENKPDPDQPAFVNAKGFDQTSAELLFRRRQQANSAIATIRECYNEFRVGRGGTDYMYFAGKLSRDSRLALAESNENKIDILKEYLDFTLSIEKLNHARVDAHAIKQQDLERSRYERLSAEIELMQAKRK